MKKKIRIGKYLVSVAISLVIASLLVGMYYLFPGTKVFSTLESSSVNIRYLFKSLVNGYFPDAKGNVRKARDGVYNRIVIAAVDDESIAANGGSFPFDRAVWADLINHFNSLPKEKQPSLVFFDIFFADKSQKPESDKKLFKAFADYDGLIGEDFILDTIRGADVKMSGSSEDVQAALESLYKKYCLDYNTNNIQAMKRFELDLQPGIPARLYPIVTPIMADISKSLKFLGTANQYPEDNTFRLKPMVVKALYKDGDRLLTKYYPSVILSMVTKLFQTDLKNITVEPGKITIKNALVNGKRIDFTLPVDDRLDLLINFKALPSTGYIKAIPLNDIKKVSLPKDAIVFVGMYSKKGTHDIWLSPMGEMYGVEVLTYALGTVLNRDFITELPLWMNIVFIYLISLLVGLFISGGNRITSAIGSIFIILSIGTGFTLFFFNIKFITFVPFISSILVLIAVQIYILLTEGREKQFIKATFSSYLNPKLVDILIQNPDMIKLGGEDKEVTVFFSGLKGLDHIAEHLDAKQLIEYMNAYFTKMADIVMDTSGTLDKYIGDAVMAFWNAPIDLPDHALKCCEAAVRMQQAVDVFNQEMEKKGFKPVVINMGVNTGRIIVGNVGSDQQKNYTAIGDAVNLASRLKGLNKFFHTNIVISEFTYKLVKDRVIARELDLTKVKGKNEPVRVYELLDVPGIAGGK